MRDAIVMSCWPWDAFNVPERISLALAHLGSRVLCCESPVSRLRRNGRPVSEIEQGVFAFGPEFFSSRLNSVPGMPVVQSRWMARQILDTARELGLRDPLFIYPSLGEHLPLCLQMKARNFYLVHYCMDYPEPHMEEHASLADKTLVIPRTAFHKLRARFGSRVEMIPQAIRLPSNAHGQEVRISEPTELARVPRPRLGYLGRAEKRLNSAVLGELLAMHPEWHFTSFGSEKPLPLPNVHVVPWQKQSELPNYVASLDVGFMPYNCCEDHDFHCVPLKLLDYFATGLPVVSTPIISLWNSGDLVYLGETAEDLAHAVRAALDEPADSSKRERRREIAREHSIENLARRLSQVLPLEQVR